MKSIFARYEVVPSPHFDIYSKGRMKGTKMARDWFDAYLKNAHHSP